MNARSALLIALVALTPIAAIAPAAQAHACASTWGPECAGPCQDDGRFHLHRGEKHACLSSPASQQMQKAAPGELLLP